MAGLSERRDEFLDWPDGRLRPDQRKRTEVPGPHGKWMERVFCISCGADGGGVTKGWAEHVIYLCDACGEHHGRLPLPEIPEAVVRGTPDG